MLGRQLIHAIKALLVLAAEPTRWRSVRDLASDQELPAPMLEQLLLQLRRAGVVEARRGRSGGYRLARPAGSITLVAVIRALDHDLAGLIPAEQPAATPLPMGPVERVTSLLEARLRDALTRELARCTLAELLFDLSSARAAQSEEGGLLLG
jgi:Rrf2 family iron-sulfur cluster assembly transcriptional regulator